MKLTSIKFTHALRCACIGLVATVGSLLSLQAAEPYSLTTVWPKESHGQLSFFWISDSGRNGFYQQKKVGEKMGELAQVVMPSFVINSGDTFHGTGVESVDDPLWISNFESIYPHPDLMCYWYPVLGNHEYDGNSQAVLDYTHRSRRWKMGGRYYTRLFPIDRTSGATLRIVFVDTTPLIPSYRHNTEKYPDVPAQDDERQLQWLDSVLTDNRATWTLVVGHHQIYSNNTLGYGDNQALIERLDPILRRHGVDFYLSGHCHTFQHIRKEGSPTEYVVNTSASLARPVDDKGGEGTLFCSPKEGFVACALTPGEFHFWVVDYEGYVVYEYAKHKP